MPNRIDSKIFPSNVDSNGGRAEKIITAQSLHRSKLKWHIFFYFLSQIWPAGNPVVIVSQYISTLIFSTLLGFFLTKPFIFDNFLMPKILQIKNQMSPKNFKRSFMLTIVTYEYFWVCNCSGNFNCLVIWWEIFIKES